MRGRGARGPPRSGMAASCEASTRASPYLFAQPEAVTDPLTLSMSRGCTCRYRIAVAVPAAAVTKSRPRRVRATGGTGGTLLRCDSDGDSGAHREHRLADAGGGDEDPRPDGLGGGRLGTARRHRRRRLLRLPVRPRLR